MPPMIIASNGSKNSDTKDSPSEEIEMKDEQESMKQES